MTQLLQVARADIEESIRARWFLVYAVVFGSVRTGRISLLILSAFGLLSIALFWLF